MTDLAWACGLFEGEGSFIQRGPVPSHRSYNVRLGATVVSNDLDVLERFESVMGCGKVVGPYSYGANTKPHWKWRLNGTDNVKALAILMWPLLCERRRRQIETAFTAVRENRVTVSLKEC